MKHVQLPITFDAYSPKFKRIVRHNEKEFSICLYSNGECRVYQSDSDRDDEDAVVLLYSGVSDCNGVEYRYGDLTMAKEGLMQVYFIEGKWILMWEDNGTFYCDLDEAKGFEIIGNIYDKKSTKKEK